MYFMKSLNKTATGKFRILKSLYKQGCVPLIFEVLRKFFGVDLRKYYDVKYKDRKLFLGFDPNMLDFKSLEDFLSVLNSEKKSLLYP